MADLIDRQAAIEAVDINTWAGFRIKIWSFQMTNVLVNARIIGIRGCRQMIGFAPMGKGERMVNFMIGYVLGVLAGAFFGLIITAVCVAASDRDKRKDQNDS